MTESTNITDRIREHFDAITSGEYNNIALVSCFINGEPGAAICTVNTGDGEGYVITPLFVSVTPGMQIINHDGEAA